MGQAAPILEIVLAAFTLVYTFIYASLPSALVLLGERASVLAGGAMMAAIALSCTAEFVISRRIGLAALAAVVLQVLLITVLTLPSTGPVQLVLSFVAVLCFFAYVLRYALHREATVRQMAEATALAQAREAEAASANRAKTAFLATMSHEIRTPLNGILGMAQVMQADELSPAQRERLGVVRQSGKALTAILNDLLDLARIESGQLELRLEPFDLRDLLVGCGQTFAALAQGKGFESRSVHLPDRRGRLSGRRRPAATDPAQPAVKRREVH